MGYIGRKLLCSKQGSVVHWEAFTWYILIVMPITFFTGIVQAISRLVMLVVISATYMIRVDETLFPSDYISFDRGYTSFISSVYLDHRHRNEVWTSLSAALINEAKTRASAGTENEASVQRAQQQTKRARTRWNFAVTLLNNPQLAVYRTKQNEGRATDQNEGNHNR